MKAVHIERAWPYVMGVAVTSVWWFALNHVFPSDPAGLMGASGTFASVLVGFLATSKAIIMSITGSRAFVRLKQVGYDKFLMRYIKEAIYCGILFLVISTVGFFFDWKSYAEVKVLSGTDLYKALWIMTGSTGLALYTRVIGLIFKVLEKV